MPTNAEINTLQKQLQNMKEANMERLNGGNGEADTAEDTGELSDVSNHPGDQGTELFEREKDGALNNLSRAQLDDIDKALQAIEDGTYGYCEVCSREIPYERLELVPESRKCIKHAQEQEPARERPVEEEVSSPTPGGRGHKESVAYDNEDTWEDVSDQGTSETPSDSPGTEGYNDDQKRAARDKGNVEEVEEEGTTDLEGEDTGDTPDGKESWSGSRNSRDN